MSEGIGIHVQVEDLKRTYIKGATSIEVLKGVNLELQAGETVAIVGPSGCGKSTLLQILGTLDRPTSGWVRFDGRDLFDRPSAQIDRLRNRNIGFVFQFHHLLPEQTALGNVALPMFISGTPKTVAWERAAHVLDEVGLANRCKHLPGELSGGEQQRVAIARALVMEPGLLLADEPTGNLDPRTADRVLDLFMALNERHGSTTVVVTHSRDLARRFPRHLAVVDGRLNEVTAS
jgi:lipoprotein-releasing system ATP-binding protein